IVERLAFIADHSPTHVADGTALLLDRGGFERTRGCGADVEHFDGFGHGLVRLVGRSLSIAQTPCVGASARCSPSDAEAHLTIRMRARIAAKKIHASMHFISRRCVQTSAQNVAQVDRSVDVSYR